ncbi:hypothetical protein RHMOL_Rhmol01G0073600 [Rhododendron molle]|uniref:Uncharacterized protein n=1 Tax=Rhododendron molle TaxID=49168 RepID=A0ACC0Q0E7_RHOML|nr:hypothetical protein RHMOL_Rhmol01G0073600 [Rhododendron molle]
MLVCVHRCFPRFSFIKLSGLLSPSVFCWVLRGVPNGLGWLAAVVMDGVVVRHITVGWFGFCLTAVMLPRQYVWVADLFPWGLPVVVWQSMVAGFCWLVVAI